MGKRVRLVFYLFVLCYVVIGARLFYWQIYAGSDLRQSAMLQYTKESLLPAARGKIVASDNAPLVMSQPAYLVYGQPKLIPDKARFAQTVGPLIGRDEQDLLADLSEEGRLWVSLARRVETDRVSELQQLKLPGIGFEKDPKRYYPEASMAAHILGFVGSDENGVSKGYFGLEGYYDRDLRGKDGLLAGEEDIKGNPILIGQQERIEPENGRTLILWTDRTVQQIVDRQLTDAVRRYGAKGGAVIVMDPKTGGILALAATPSYDPAHFTEYDKSLYRNPLVADSYEPGSTFKALIMSAALESGVVEPQTQMQENGPVQIGEYAIRTWDSKYHGVISMTQVLQYSSNVGMVFVGRKLGKEGILRTIHEFGFGKPTGVDLQDETSPSIRDDKDWGEIDLATATFGQGIAVTPIQMVRAVGALANDGWLMEPHVVKEIVDQKGRRTQVRPKRIRQVIGEQSARLITEMLINAVDNGEAKWAKPKGYRIAGKTGTAQIPVSGHYDEEKTIASFVGFAPADTPRFVMLVLFREPTTSPWGSETAAPTFFSIARELFAYWAIPADR